MKILIMLMILSLNCYGKETLIKKEKVRDCVTCEVYQSTGGGQVICQSHEGKGNFIYSKYFNNTSYEREIIKGGYKYTYRVDPPIPEIPKDILKKYGGLCR